MKGFVEVIVGRQKKVSINVEQIVSFIEAERDKTLVYTNCENACYTVDMKYSDFKKMLEDLS